MCRYERMRQANITANKLQLSKLGLAFRNGSNEAAHKHASSATPYGANPGYQLLRRKCKAAGLPATKNAAELTRLLAEHEAVERERRKGVPDEIIIAIPTPSTQVSLRDTAPGSPVQRFSCATVSRRAHSARQFKPAGGGRRAGADTSGSTNARGQGEGPFLALHVDISTSTSTSTWPHNGPVMQRVTCQCVLNFMHASHKMTLLQWCTHTS